MIVILRSLVPVIVPALMAAAMYGVSCLIKRTTKQDMNVLLAPSEYAYFGLLGLVAIIVTQWFVSTINVSDSMSVYIHAGGAVFSALVIATIFFPACIVLPTGNSSHRSQTMMRATALWLFCLVAPMATKAVQDWVL